MSLRGAQATKQSRFSKATAPDSVEIVRLQAMRLKLHRLDPPRPIRNLRVALAFIKERRIVLSTGRSSLPMLAEVIAGRHLRGSWMANPEVYQIYELLKRIYRHPDVLSASIVLGKDTLIHESLGPAVERIASDPERRRVALAALPPLARRLLNEVERAGEVRMDRWSASTKPAREARLRLERDLLAISRELHTERGYHTAVVLPWRRSKSSTYYRVKARRLTYDRAVDEVMVAAIHSAVIAPEREVRRWFQFGRNRLDTMIQRGTLARLGTGRQTWLALHP